MRGAATKVSRAGIKNARLASYGVGRPFPVVLLPLVIGIMTDEKTPAHSGIFRSERMEGGDMVIFMYPRRASGQVFKRIAARFQQYPPHSRVGEPRRKRAAASTRTDDDIIALSHAQQN